jgi:hypothetical protein
MRYLIGVIFTAMCGSPPPPPPVAPAPTLPRAPATKPECTTRDGRTGSQFAAQLYCAKVKDSCCGTGLGQQWTCGNANYYDWYFANCGPR